MSGETKNTAVLEWIDHILKAKKWNGTELARKSNLAPSTVLRMINDPNHRFVPSFRTLKKIADGSGYPIPQHLVEDLTSPVGREAYAEELRPPKEYGVGALSATRKTVTVDPRDENDIPVLYVSALPTGLQAKPFKDQFAPFLPQFKGDDTAFAFYMPDDSMTPVVSAGMLCYGTKRRDPKADDLLLVTTKDGRTIVRTFTGMDSNGLKLAGMEQKDDRLVEFDDIKEIGIVAVIVRM